MRPLGPSGALAEVQVPRLSVVYGRLLTLGAVDDVEPRVLDELGEVPLRTLKASGWDQHRDGLLTLRVVRRQPELRAFWASLTAWSTRWHLTDDWCMEIALSTLTHKTGGKRLAWFEPHTHFGVRAPVFRAPVLSPPGLRHYDVTGEARCDYEAYARMVLNPKLRALDREMAECFRWRSGCSPEEQDRRLARARELGDRMMRVSKRSVASDRSLNDYLDRVESAAHAAGLVQVPPVFRQPLVFRWLAGYQVCGWSPRQIALATRVYRYSEAYHNSIVHGIKRLASHVGLTLRRGRSYSPRRANLARRVDEIRAALNGELRKRARSAGP